MGFKSFYYLDDLKAAFEKYGQVTYYANDRKSSLLMPELRDIYEPDLLFLDKSGEYGLAMEFKDYGKRETVPVGQLAAISQYKNTVEGRYPFLVFVLLTQGEISSLSSKMLHELKIPHYNISEYRNNANQLANGLIAIARARLEERGIARKEKSQSQFKQNVVIFKELERSLNQLTVTGKGAGVPGIVNAIQRHRVLLFNHASKCISSGTLVDIGKALVILTAHHSIEGSGKDNILINLGIPYQDCSYMIERIWSDPKLDIAYLQINREEARKYLRGLEPVYLGKRVPFNTIAPNYRAVALIGYPAANAVVDNQRKLFDVRTLYVLSQFVRPENWPSNIDANPSHHLLIEYGSESGKDFIDNVGNIVQEVKDPGGMSGASVWKFNPETMYDDNQSYAIIGIQTGWHPKHKLLQATIIDPIIDQLQNDFGTTF